MTQGLKSLHCRETHYPVSHQGSLLLVVFWSLSCVRLFATPHTAICRLLCPSLSTGVHSDLCPLSWWCQPTILSSVSSFCCLQSCLALGYFPVIKLFPSGGQSIGASASASVLPMSIQGWFPLGSTGLISLNPRDSLLSSPTLQFKCINSSALNLLYGPILTSIQDYWEDHSFDYMLLCQKNDVSTF